MCVNALRIKLFENPKWHSNFFWWFLSIGKLRCGVGSNRIMAHRFTGSCTRNNLMVPQWDFSLQVSDAVFFVSKLKKNIFFYQIHTSIFWREKSSFWPFTLWPWNVFFNLIKTLLDSHHEELLIHPKHTNRVRMPKVEQGCIMFFNSLMRDIQWLDHLFRSFSMQPSHQ